MYEMKVESSIEEHQDDLAFLSATVEAAHAEGLLGDEALALIQQIDELVEEGDQLITQRRKEERSSVKTEAKIRVGENVQESAVSGLFKECMNKAELDRQAPLVKTLFEGGVSAMMRPALQAQNMVVRELVGKLNTQDQYAGAIRDAHAPKLTATIDKADTLLKGREQHTRDQEHRATKARDWKLRGNVLRGDVGGWLMQQAAAQQSSSARSYARDFFKR